MGLGLGIGLGLRLGLGLGLGLRVGVRANPCITLSILRLARTASASRPRRLSEVTACAPRTQCLRDMQKTIPGSICADASACAMGRRQG